jgi:hypothetical protein
MTALLPAAWAVPAVASSITTTVTFDASASAADLFYGPTTIEREDRGSFNEALEMAPTPIGPPRC